jgi:nitrite reductase/ring-hydroxylating ferredoxin subunit
MLSDIEQALCAARPNHFDPAAVQDLHYLGNYTRRLPVTLTRMMENAHDWEHLPFIHPSSFASIDLIDSGPWGWRAKLGVPSGGHQLIDLLVDMDRHYWVSTVISGMGQGTEIHTQAADAGEGAIDIEVRFYLPSAPADPSIGAVALHYLRGQYTQLYDEDEALMLRRQSALNDRRRWTQVDQIASEPVLCLGPEAALDRTKTHSVEWRAHRYCLRFWHGQWIVHSAVCPHLLGPLDGGEVATDGTITCPWHGYRFDIQSGMNQDGQCKDMKKPPLIEIREGQICLTASEPVV